MPEEGVDYVLRAPEVFGSDFFSTSFDENQGMSMSSVSPF
jgi:hypothetical protein